MVFDNQTSLEGLCERDRSNLNRFRAWAIPFALTFVLAAVLLGPPPEAVNIPLWHFAIALLPFIPGYFALSAYFKFAREADEMIRHVMNEAAARSFAIMIILGFAYNMFTQLYGDWAESGIFIWIIGYFAFYYYFFSAWKKFNV